MMQEEAGLQELETCFHFEEALAVVHAIWCFVA